MATLQQMIMQPSPVGEVIMSMADLTGPASYSRTTPPIVSPNAFALIVLKGLFPMGLTKSGTYYVRAVTPNGPGSNSITVRWYVTATDAEVANTTNLSAETVRYLAIGN